MFTFFSNVILQFTKIDISISFAFSISSLKSIIIIIIFTLYIHDLFDFNMPFFSRMFHVSSFSWIAFISTEVFIIIDYSDTFPIEKISIFLMETVILERNCLVKSLTEREILISRPIPEG